MKRLLMIAMIFAASFSEASDKDNWKTSVLENGLRKVRTIALAVTPNGNFPATLTLQCRPGPEGAITIYFTISDADQIKLFPFDQFEGPDAPASKKKLGRIQIISKTSRVTVHKELSGFYPNPQSFAFSFSAPSGEKSDVTDLLDRLIKGAGTFSICATTESQLQICSDFNVRDAEKPIAETVKPCY